MDCNFVQEQQSLVLVLRTGAIITIDANRKVEAAAEMPERILAARWSPSEENLVIVTGKFVVLLDAQFNPQKEDPIDDEDESIEASEAEVSWSADGKVPPSLRYP